MEYMTPEQRLNRVERILGMMATSGRKARSEFRENINILINMHVQNEEHCRAQSDALNQKINILVETQMETTEQIKKLAAGQARTERALRRKPRNGNSST
jgi:hypothetical protein